MLLAVDPLQAASPWVLGWVGHAGTSRLAPHPGWIMWQRRGTLAGKRGTFPEDTEHRDPLESQIFLNLCAGALFGCGLVSVLGFRCWLKQLGSPESEALNPTPQAQTTQGFTL